MKKIFCMLLLSAMVFLVACAPKQPISRDVQIALQERTMKAAVKVYDGFSVDQIAQAAEKVLYLMDPSDMKIAHQKNRIFTHRFHSQWLVLANVFGFDTWVVSFKELGNNRLQVSVAAGASESSGLVALPPTPRSPEEVTLEYSVLCEAEAKLFFERLDYFLGLTKNWRSCEGTKEWAKENDYLITPGFDGLPFMCGHNRFSGLEDKTPEYLIK